MKRTILLLSTCLLLFYHTSSGQIAGKKPFDNYYKKKVQVKLINENTPKNIFFFTSTIPFNFTRLETDGAVWNLGASFAVGNGVLFVLGKSIKNLDETRTIQPTFSFGIAADVGFKQDGSNIKTTLSGNLIFGFDKIALAFGRDFLNNTTFIGLSVRLDLFAIAPNSLIVLKEW